MFKISFQQRVINGLSIGTIAAEKFLKRTSGRPNSDSDKNETYRALIKRADGARDRIDWESAAESYEAALAINSDDAAIWVQLGNMLKDGREFVRSRSAYQKALEMRPDDADSYLQLGHLYKLMGESHQAALSYAQAKRLDPGNPNVHAELQRSENAVARAPNHPVVPLKPVGFATPTRKSVARVTSLRAQTLASRNALQQLLVASPSRTAREVELLAAARPALLEAISALSQTMGDQLHPEGPASSSVPAEVATAFDVSDLLQYFRNHRLPTGIQRVQIEAISVALGKSAHPQDVRVCCFTEDNDYWREIPASMFLDLCALSLANGDLTAPDWRDLMAELDEHLSQAGDFEFSQGSFLINIGTSWWLQNYFLYVREAKQRSGIKYVPFVHDMIPIMTPEYCVDGLVRDFIGWAQAVYAHADFFFVNSEATRRDLLRVGQYLGHEINDWRVKTVRLDADYRKPQLDLTDPVSNLRQHRLAPRGYVLFVSTIEARKNHVGVFDAWLQLCKDHGDDAVPKLVCVGSRGWLNEAVFAKLAASKRLRDKVVMLSNVPDHELAILYGECLFSVYPSFYEGWGLPVTESLSSGRAVLTARSSSLPEAGGSFADYFDLDNASDLLTKLKRLIFDGAYRHEREDYIRAEFCPRSWAAIAADFQDAVAGWIQKSDMRQGEPFAIQLGRYYSFARNEEIKIHPGMQSGEVFRTGKRWWGANNWGCWLKPGPAEIEFSLPIVDQRLRIAIGLFSAAGTDSPFDLMLMPGTKIAGVIPGGRTKWVTLEFDANETRDKIQIVIEGFSKHMERPRAELSPIEVSIAVVGLFVCAASDSAARTRFIEAVALDDLSSLSRTSLEPDIFPKTAALI